MPTQVRNLSRDATSQQGVSPTKRGVYEQSFGWPKGFSGTAKNNQSKEIANIAGMHQGVAAGNFQHAPSYTPPDAAQTENRPGKPLAFEHIDSSKSPARSFHPPGPMTLAQIRIIQLKSVFGGAREKKIGWRDSSRNKSRARLRRILSQCHSSELRRPAHRLEFRSGSGVIEIIAI